MTSTQNQAIWELCRQGLHEAAARAERRWGDGERFEPEPRLPVTREIAHLIDCGNWDACRNGAAPRMARAPSARPAPALSAAA